MKFLQGPHTDLSKMAFQSVDGKDGYPKTTTCLHCDSSKSLAGDPQAVLLGVLDDERGQELCKQPKPAGMKYWPHDSCSIAIYLCGNCLQVTGKFTQA
jgi:hypothetical protein